MQNLIKAQKEPQFLDKIAKYKVNKTNSEKLVELQVKLEEVNERLISMGDIDGKIEMLKNFNSSLAY